MLLSGVNYCQHRYNLPVPKASPKQRIVEVEYRSSEPE